VFTVEPPFNSQNDWVYAPVDNTKRYINPSRLLRMSVMSSIAVSQVGIWLKWYLSTTGEGERPVLLRCLAVSADAFSNQTCRRTLFIYKTMLLTAKLVIFCLLWFSKVR